MRLVSRCFDKLTAARQAIEYHRSPPHESFTVLAQPQFWFRALAINKLLPRLAVDQREQPLEFR
jgi:hypothetical protein